MSAQKEQLKAIGQRLSEERQKKSITLEEIAARTYIPQRLLTAIEDANLDRLPEPVFIQGFIRRFADAIGLDGMAMSKEFTVDPAPLPAPTTNTLISNTIEPQIAKSNGVQPPKPPEPPKPASIQPPKSIAPPTPHSPEPAAIRDPQPISKIEPTAIRDSEPRLSTDDSPSRLPLIALGAAIGLGVIGVLAATLANRPAERSTPVAATSPAVKPSKAPVTQPPRSPAPAASTPASPAPAASASPAASPSPSASPAATGPVNVKMNVTEESWVEVLVDGNSVFEGTLPKGTQKNWSGKQVVVNTGNAGGVSLSYNNEAAKAMGAAGDLGSASFPPTP